MATWLSIVLGAINLFGALVEMARASKQTDEGSASALLRVMNDATETLKKARDARDAADTRDATADGLQHPDGWQRD